MKILKDYPNTVKQLIDSLAELDDELQMIKISNVGEIIKALPESFIVKDDGELLRAFIPSIFVNRFKNGDAKRVSKRVWEQLQSQVPEVAKINGVEIFAKISQCFDSNSYDDRVGGAHALKELCSSLGEDQLQHKNFAEVVDAMMRLVLGKYFNEKEQIVECLGWLVREDFLQDEEKVGTLLQGSCEQI